MKIVKEDLDNLEKVKNPQAVMSPVMAAAKQDSIEAKKKANEVAGAKKEPFLGASKQPTPKKPETAKVSLDESLFEEINSIEEFRHLKDKISDYVAESVYDTILDLNISSIPGYEYGWADTSEDSPSRSNFMSKITELGNAFAQYALWFAPREFSEGLNESPALDGRQRSTLPPGGSKFDIAEEEDDLWTRVANELDSNIDPQDTDRKIKATKKDRYADVLPDMDGNILVFGADESRMEFAKLVAREYGLEIKVQPTRSRNPKMAWQATIYIPNDDIYDFDEDLDKNCKNGKCEKVHNEDDDLDEFLLGGAALGAGVASALGGSAATGALIGGGAGALAGAGLAAAGANKSMDQTADLLDPSEEINQGLDTLFGEDVEEGLEESRAKTASAFNGAVSGLAVGGIPGAIVGGVGGLLNHGTNNEVTVPATQQTDALEECEKSTPATYGAIRRK